VLSPIAERSLGRAHERRVDPQVALGVEADAGERGVDQLAHGAPDAA
jgi:hypothetical protein